LRERLEPIAEYSLLNILCLLKYVRDKIEKEDAKELKKLEKIVINDKEHNIIFEILKILCDRFTTKEILNLRSGKEKHPFIFYKFLLIVGEWDEFICKNINDSGNKWIVTDKEKIESKNFVDYVEEGGSAFKYFFDEIYTDAKYEIYRQLSLRQASDSSLFDVKRLIYGLLIVKLNDRYSNDLVMKKVLDLIFELHDGTTGLWPICHSVNSDFYVKNGDIGEEYKDGVIISENPVLSSIGCLNDILEHEYIKLNEKYRKKLYITYNWILNRIIKENGVNIGWYPEYERDRTPKSWITGRTLIFLKRYCEEISKLIEREASKSVSAEESTDFIDWKDLADSYCLKEIINKNIITPIKDEGKSAKRSMILFGPPGSGKSTVGRALAKELGWGYVELTPGLFLDEGDDKIISKLNRVFKRLVKLKEKVIFFDEVDQLVKERQGQSGERSKWIVTSILPKLSELRAQDDIIFMLATNHPDEIDEAIKRLGRIDFILPVGSISWKYRLKMLKRKVEWAEEGKMTTSYAYTKIKENFSTPSFNCDRNNLPSEFQRYLERTNYISFVQIGRILEEMFSETYPEFYDIFFEDDPARKFHKFEDKGFKEFEDDKIKLYSRLPLNVTIEDCIRNNALYIA
jgi:ABC-type oligopeptide transport system ATPase subunit